MGKGDPHPKPPVNYQIGVSVWKRGTTPVSGVIEVDDGNIITGIPGGLGRDLLFSFNCPPVSYKWGGWMTIKCNGYKDSRTRVIMDQNSYDIDMIPVLPQEPTRDEICSSATTLQGLFFNHSSFGNMPLFEACLPWLDSASRQSVYQAKRVINDKRLCIEVPNNKPLYDEPDNAYSPDRFPALSLNIDSFVDLIYEVINEGFFPQIHMDEIQSESERLMPIIATALRDSKYGNLLRYCILIPGWDGVFYGWPVEAIIKWAEDARAIDPNIYLFLEFSSGHIPFGEGGSDYLPNGRMMIFDGMLSEHGAWLPYNQLAGDQVWQILARIGCYNGYNRPSDQPRDDDPNPPNYICDSVTPRGKFYSHYFENGIYEFVRDKITVDQIKQQNQYIKNLGTTYGINFL